MNEIARRHGPDLLNSRQIAVVALALAVGAGALAGCGDGGCGARTQNGATPCNGEHALIICDPGDPEDGIGPSEQSASCPPDRPVCQQATGSASGACVSLAPLMCIEQVVAPAATNSRMAVADLDGDGLTDVVFDDNGDLRVAMGRADGSFAKDMSLGVEPTVWTFADLNGDKVPDLIGGAGTAGTTTLSLGAGDGTFGLARPLPAIQGTIVARGDFDADGAVDLVDYVFTNDASVDIAVHLAADSFAAGETLHFSAAVGAFGVAAYPLQTGGRQWVLEVDREATTAVPASADLRIIGDLAGGLLATIPVTRLPGDYDGDGNTDLIIGGAVALGDGAGGFRQDPSRPAGGVVAADLDGDGRLDLEQLDVSQTSSMLTTLHGTGDGHFTAGPPVYVERSISGDAPLPIHLPGRRGTDLVVIAIRDTSDTELRILRGDCP